MIIQLALNLGTAFASTPATDVYYRVLSGESTVRVERTNAGVRSDDNGSFSADVDIDGAWHPCRVIWDDGGVDNTPTVSVTAPIEEPNDTSDIVDEAAIVSGVVGGLSGQRFSCDTPVLPDGSLRILQGDDYSSITQRPLPLRRTEYIGRSLSGRACSFKIMERREYELLGTAAQAILTLTANITQSGDAIAADFAMTTAQSLLLPTAPPAPSPSCVGQWITDDGQTLVLVRVDVIKRVP